MVWIQQSFVNPVASFRVKKKNLPTRICCMTQEVQTGAPWQPKGGDGVEGGTEVHKGVIVVQSLSCV